MGSLHRLLVMETEDVEEFVLSELESSGIGNVEIVGFIDDDPQRLGQKVSLSVAGIQREKEPQTELKVLGDYASVEELIQRHKVTTLVFGKRSSNWGDLVRVLSVCGSSGLEVISVEGLYEKLTSQIFLKDPKNISFNPLPFIRPRRFYKFLKRLFDVISVGAGLLLLLPFFPLIAVAIYLDSKGPIFYSQDRVGENGKLFRLWKFRSMRVDAEKDGAVWAKKNDDRITRVGKFLRKTHIDEFPQFWNILKGEMAVVGPRPERPEFVTQLQKLLPLYPVRLVVKPGMAGWGLVCQGYGSSVEDAATKLQYDLYYVKHRSIVLDIIILLRTIIDAVRFEGR